MELRKIENFIYGLQQENHSQFAKVVLYIKLNNALNTGKYVFSCKISETGCAFLDKSQVQ